MEAAGFSGSFLGLRLDAGKAAFSRPADQRVAGADSPLGSHLVIKQRVALES